MEPSKPSLSRSLAFAFICANLERSLRKYSFWPGANNPVSSNNPKSTRGANRFLSRTSKISSVNGSGVMLSILFCATEIYFSSCSIPIQCRCNFFATAPVVPLPKNGSKTISPGLLDERITRYSKASGFCVE